MRIELIYFDGCAHASRARANIEAAVRAAGGGADIVEWNQADGEAPAYVRGHGSPTVLVDGRDVMGAAAVGGPSCRVEGAPTVAAILHAIVSR